MVCCFEAGCSASCIYFALRNLSLNCGRDDSCSFFRRLQSGHKPTKLVKLFPRNMGKHISPNLFQILIFRDFQRTKHSLCSEYVFTLKQTGSSQSCLSVAGYGVLEDLDFP